MNNTEVTILELGFSLQYARKVNTSTEQWIVSYGRNDDRTGFSYISGTYTITNVGGIAQVEFIDELDWDDLPIPVKKTMLAVLTNRKSDDGS